MMRARVGAEAICRVERRYSHVRIANIRMNREQFSVVIHPIPNVGALERRRSLDLRRGLGRQLPLHLRGLLGKQSPQPSHPIQ